MAVVLALHFAGIVAPDLTSERMGALRGTYGYGHPNTFGGLVFGLVLAYALLRAQKVRWVDCLLVFAVGVFLLVGPASRSAALCTLALAVGLVFCRLRAGHSVPRWWPGTCAGMVGLTAAVSYLCRCWSSRWDRGTMISAPHGWQSWTPCSPAASR